MQITVITIFLPISFMLSGDYPANVVFGQICMLEKLPKQNLREIVEKDRMMGFIFPIIFASLVSFFNIKIKILVKRHCTSQRTFSCYGGMYKRNLMTLSESLNCSFYWNLFIILENILLLILRVYSEELGEIQIFIIYNTFFFIFGDFYNCIYLPMRIIHTSKNQYAVLWTKSEPKSTRTDCKEESNKVPRRDFYPEVQISTSCFMYNSRKRNIEKYQLPQRKLSICAIDID